MREDWIECKFGDIITFKNGYAFKSTRYLKSGIPVIRIGDIKENEVLIEDAICVDENKDLKEYEIVKDDILIAMSGATTGKFGRYNLNRKAYLNQRVGNIKPLSDKYIYKSFLFYLLSQLKREIERSAYGGAQPNISSKKIEELAVAFAPLPEQRAIVKKLESLFSSLDAGVADLNKAQQQLKIYRQAVLKKAFEGELTKEWREKQYTLPDSDEVLKIVEQERENYYNSSIEEWKNSTDKRKAKPQKNKHYSKISKDDYDNLPKLPSNWGWEKFGNVCLKIMDGTHFSPKNIERGDYKYITAKNIKEGRIDLKKLSFVTKEDHSEIFARCDVKKGDILYIKDGATAGIAAVNPFEEEFSLLSSVGVFRTSHNVILPKFMEYYLNAQITKNRMLSNISGVAITRLTLIKLNNSIFVICSPEEQKEIVKQIESRLSVCDSIEQNIKESLVKAEALRQSILKKAFEGNLLTAQELAECKQAVDYEPASVLLERIKAEQKSPTDNTDKRRKKAIKLR